MAASQTLAASHREHSGRSWCMSTKSRESIYGTAIRMSAERANEARKEADRLACEAWNYRMLGYKGPAQPSPTLDDALNAGSRSMWCGDRRRRRYSSCALVCHRSSRYKNLLWSRFHARMASLGNNNSFPFGGGEMGALIRLRNWSDTGLGPVSGWSQSLQTTVGILLRSPVPIVLLWGPDGIMIYNDAYSVFAEGRHHLLFGSKVREGW